MDPTLTNPVNRALACLLSEVFDPVCLPTTESDWDSVMKKAGAFGLLPFLANVFQNIPNLPVPVPVVQTAEHAREWNTQSLLRRMAVLRRLTKALDVHHIPVILLKGMALAHLVYPSPECRQMSDVDLLVPQGKLSMVRDIALTIGLEKSEYAQDLESVGSALQDEPVCQLKTSDGLVRFDIHDAIPSFHPFGYDLDIVWNRSVLVNIRDQETRVLHPIDFLSHVSLHLAHHHCFTSRLLSCLDIRLFLASGFGQSLDWSSLIQESKENGSFPWLQFALVVSQDILHFKLPPEFTVDVPEDFAAARQMAIEQCFHTGRMPINAPFMQILASPSMSSLRVWMRDNWRQHKGHSQLASQSKTQLHLLKYVAARIRRFGWLLSREGMSISRWRTVIHATRSREQLARLADASNRIAKNQ